MFTFIINYMYTIASRFRFQVIGGQFNICFGSLWAGGVWTILCYKFRIGSCVAAELYCNVSPWYSAKLLFVYFVICKLWKY